MQLGLPLALGTANPAAWAGPLTGQTLSASGYIGPETAVVGNGPEFNVNDGAFFFDFSEDGMLTLRAASFALNFNAYSTYTFRDYLGTIADIVGIELLGIGSGVSGFDMSMVSFTADSLQVRLNGASWTWTASSQLQLQIEFAQPTAPAASVPEPGTVALAGLALVALATTDGRRRRG